MKFELTFKMACYNSIWDHYSSTPALHYSNAYINSSEELIFSKFILMVKELTPHG